MEGLDLIPSNGSSTSRIQEADAILVKDRTLLCDALPELEQQHRRGEQDQHDDGRHQRDEHLGSLMCL